MELLQGRPEPEPLNLAMPKDPATSKVTINDKTYTILLLSNNRTYIYKGTDINNKLIISDLHNSQVRNIIKTGKQKYGAEFFIVIKPSEESSYKDAVDILDEMVINNIKKYVMVDITNKEKNFIKQLK
jgi:hypothetical protein